MVEAQWRLLCVLKLQARIHDAFFASHPLASLGDDPFSRSVNADVEILHLPGYLPLWRHELVQESAVSRAFFNLLKERRKTAALLNIEKTTNEPTLGFPYNLTETGPGLPPAAVPAAQPDPNPGSFSCKIEPLLSHKAES
jgi:hypothetical protein